VTAPDSQTPLTSTYSRLAGFRWVECGRAHLPAIRQILNDAILNSTALYDYEPRSEETMERWFETKTSGGWPVIGVETAEGELAGFASYGPFRAFPAYKYTAEHSVYVAAPHRGLGLGRLLLEGITARAEVSGIRTLVGVIDAENTASTTLHERLGFERCGEIRHAGFKFGRWLDLVFYQRQLSGPENPVDG
jgi:L-amino acid N-acyltransferase YncA